MADMVTTSGGHDDATPLPAGGATLAFDITDLLDYFRDNRAPTGVQRVQTDLVDATLAIAPERSLAVCFLPARQEWVPVPATALRELVAIARRNGTAKDPAWIEAHELFMAGMGRAAAFAFSPGTVLVSLGTSWWLTDFFIRVRDLKERSGVRLAMLFYDIIPITCPADVARSLTDRFTDWFVGAARHADFFLAISNATKRDVVRAADEIGRAVADEEVGVLPLNISFIEQSTSRFRMQPGPSVGAGDYVLFVSTVERRKNQLMALSAWRALINRHGVERVPQLVLVGKMGFDSEKVEQRLANDDQLRQRVTLLSAVEDDVLADLYRGCLFTIYPSSYEGWGLPITESLSFHRPVLAADNSSLPEAGGDLAMFFRTGSASEFERGLERLIFDKDQRRALAARIAREFVNGSWPALARSMIAHLDRRAADAPPRPAMGGRAVRRGCYYALQTHPKGPLFRGMNAGEVFRLGNGWFPVEPWGTWSRPGGGWLHLETADDRPLTIAVQVRGLPAKATTVSMVRRDGQLLARAEAPPDRERWITFTVTPADGLVEFGVVAADAGQVGGDTREFGVGVIGFFVLGDEATAARTLVEAIALGSLNDHNPFRNPALGDRGAAERPAGDARA